MADSIGTVTVNVLPDLEEFTRLMQQLPGVTLTETTTFMYDTEGNVVKQVRTVTVSGRSD